MVATRAGLADCDEAEEESPVDVMRRGSVGCVAVLFVAVVPPTSMVLNNPIKSELTEAGDGVEGSAAPAPNPNKSSLLLV